MKIKTAQKINRTLNMFEEHGIIKHQPSFGAKICSDICLRTFSVQRSKQFSESFAFLVTRVVLKIWNITRIFPSFSWGIFSHVRRLDQLCESENI